MAAKKCLTSSYGGASTVYLQHCLSVATVAAFWVAASCVFFVVSGAEAPGMRQTPGPLHPIHGTHFFSHGRLTEEHERHRNVTSEQREERAHLVRKYLRRPKKHDGAVKLVEGSGDHEGNVEIFHLGRWGSVCDDEWDMREAMVICRQLGFEGAVKITHSSQFGPARRRYWMDNVYCTGEEKRLSDCRFDGWGLSDCSPAEAAGVVCIDPNAKTTTTTTPAPPKKMPKVPIKNATKHTMKLRLVGGRVPEEGRVEVKFGEGWGLVCGDGWDMLAAVVVCRQLGLGYAQDAVQTDFFGGNGTQMVLSGVQCTGTEQDLSHCLHDRLGSDNVVCPGRTENIAAVVCASEMADLVIDHLEIMRSAHLEDKQLFFLQCAMEENCLASPAYKLHKERPGEWHLITRRLLRFTARIINAGTADFRPAVPKHLWEFHQCHMHYHSMEVFATFDVMDLNGRRVAEGHKASFCLEDNQCLPGVKPVYACANYGDQGITVGCSDIYRHNIDCQWVDITELNPGLYTFRVSVNPEFKVAEMSFENNAAVCNMYYTESFIHIFNCSLQRPS